MLKLRRTAVLGAVLCLQVVAAAAPSRPVQLVDPQGNPIAGVNVSVLGRSGSFATDEQGRFRLIPVPTPPFELAVFDERGAVIGIVQVATAAELNEGRLVVAPRRLEEVTVLSGAAPATAAPPAAAASVFSRVEKEESQPSRLTDVLGDVPGTTVVGSGAAAVPVIRGLARGRTLILLDDARVTAERRAGPSATFLNPFGLESVEIVRGPGSVAYGSDALGGIIHARTPVPSTANTSGRYEVSAGAGRNEGAAAVEWNLDLGESAVLMQAHGRRASDYDSPSGPVPVSSSSDFGFLLRGSVPAGERRLLLGLKHDRAEDVGKPATNSDRVRTIYPVEQSSRFSMETTLPGFSGFDGIDLHVFAGRYRLVTDRDELATPVTDRSVERSDVDANDASLRLVGTRPWGSGLLRVGVDVSSRFDLDARALQFEQPAGQPLLLVSEDRAIESATRIDSGLFVEGERIIERIGGSFAFGVRGDYVSTENRGGGFGDRSTSNSAPSGYAAFSLHPRPGWNLSLQYGRGFRDPSLSDRYFRGVTGRGTIIGNPDLDPETADQVDLAVYGRFGRRVRLGAFAYHYRIRDLIERFRDPAQTDVFLFRNRGRAELNGAELELDVDLPRGLAMRFTANYSDGEIRDDGSPAADVPPESVRLSLRRRVENRYWWRIHYAWFFRDDDPGDSELVTPGYGLLDLSGGIRLSPRVEGRLILKNALHRAYPDSSDDRAPLAPGRTVTFVLAGTF